MNKILNHFDLCILIGIGILFMPFFGLSSTIDPVLMPRFLVWGIMASVLFISFVIRLLIKPNGIDCSILRRIIFSAFLGYLLFSLISLTKAANITEGIYESLKIFLSIVYLFITTIILSKKKDYISIIAKAVTIAATALSAISVYEYLKYGSINYTATMANKNQLASAFFLMLPFCLYVTFGFRKLWKAAGVISTALILFNILLLQARSVWLGFLISTFVTTLVMAFVFGKTGIIQRRTIILRRLAYAIAVLVIVVSTAFHFHFKSSSIVDSITRSQSVTNRLLVWRKSLELANDNLLLGVGSGNWRITLPSCGIDNLPKLTFERKHYQRPHNDYLWVLCETGIFGLIFYLSIFGIIFRYIFKILNSHMDTNNKLLSILMFFGFAGYMVFSCFTFPRERIFHSMFLLLMMAIVISIYHRSSDNLKNIPRPFMFAIGILSVVLLALAVTNGHTRLNAEVYTKRALAARKAKNWPAVISEIDKGYSVFATLDPMSTPLKWYRGEANFLLNNVSQALEDFQKAYKAHPYHIHVLNNLATCYEMIGNHDLAINYYKKSLEIFPEFEDALINLGATYYNSGRYEEAHQTLLRCKKNNKKVRKYLKAVNKKIDSKNGL